MSQVSPARADKRNLLRPQCVGLPHPSSPSATTTPCSPRESQETGDPLGSPMEGGSSGRPSKDHYPCTQTTSNLRATQHCGTGNRMSEKPKMHSSFLLGAGRDSFPGLLSKMCQQPRLIVFGPQESIGIFLENRIKPGSNNKPPLNHSHRSAGGESCSSTCWDRFSFGVF